ncbi:uncharacterized protein F5147DRAFT_679245 [Suillus discolor]|uniref:Uncharacterized protein n=1 Tax=Suillus discolor TaxID=1912936 RepID=A0A9P7FE80_9AGAM|nr:uncharacterized protein F5147DRAFT_679245 [Suillus discolor]KAG2114363.1 hypothetical protein F5147DRAFT_679245 [Suillus discolor]
MIVMWTSLKLFSITSTVVLLALILRTSESIHARVSSPILTRNSSTALSLKRDVPDVLLPSMTSVSLVESVRPRPTIGVVPHSFLDVRETRVTGGGVDGVDCGSVSQTLTGRFVQCFSPPQLQVSWRNGAQCRHSTRRALLGISTFT